MVKPRPGRLATSWHSNKFLNPLRDGAVLPILHLNGYKIAGPTVLARIPHATSWSSCCAATAIIPTFVEGHEPAAMHDQMAETLDRVLGGNSSVSRVTPGQARDTDPRLLADDRAAQSERAGRDPK